MAKRWKQSPRKLTENLEVFIVISQISFISTVAADDFESVKSDLFSLDLKV